MGHNGRWFSFQHHSSFSRSSPDEAIAAMNDARAAASTFLSSASFLFLTFGSSWAFELAATGEVVANCHKQPQSLFTRRMVPSEEAASALYEALQPWMALNPALTVVVTVSPVRHWKDGPVLNSLSKSSLVVAAHALVHRLGASGLYFPSYEIMMDDLRDYRFYQQDMLHPSTTAVDYIWDRLEESFMAAGTRRTLQRIKNVRRAVSHRAFDPSGDAHQRFLQAQHRAVRDLERELPQISFAAEKAVLEQDMTDDTIRSVAKSFCEELLREAGA